VPVVDLADVVAEIRARTPVGPTRLVGIDGPAGSGKSTLARELAPLLDAPIATTDDFLSWTDLHGWWPRVESDLLAPLLGGRDASYRVRDWRGDPEGDGLDGWRTTPWSATVVLEGVTSTRREIADRLTYRIWVEAPEEVRRERNLNRADYWHDHWDAWVRLETAFFSADGTRDRADLVVRR
jgi:energy-coupling factor transporter ATP-binding protein EcfA2